MTSTWEWILPHIASFISGIILPLILYRLYRNHNSNSALFTLLMNRMDKLDNTLYESNMNHLRHIGKIEVKIAKIEDHLLPRVNYGNGDDQ